MPTSGSDDSESSVEAVAQIKTFKMQRAAKTTNNKVAAAWSNFNND